MATKEQALKMSLSTSDVSDFADWVATAYPGVPEKYEWKQQTQRYERWWDYYSGEALKGVMTDKPTGNSDSNLATPLRINVFKRHADLHAMLTFGVFTSNELVRFWAEPLKVTRADESKVEDPFLGRLLSAVWKENAWMDILPESGRIMQALGGFYMKAVHDPAYVNGVRIELLPANCVFPVFDSFHNINEAWVAYWINREQAAYYGLKTEKERVLYVEHWDKNKWDIKVGDPETKEMRVAVIQTENGPRQLAEKNPYLYPDGKTRIPIFYAPRFRTGSHYGTSIVSDIIGLTGELNERAGDVGDAIGDSSHRLYFATDWRGKRDGQNYIEVSQGQGVVNDAGSTPAGSEKPNVFTIDPPTINEGYIKFLGWIEAQAFDTTFTAPVLFGRDEGSQRSGETLAARALPTLAAVTQYRTSYSEFFNRINRHILVCMSVIVEGAQETRNGVTTDDIAGNRFNVDFWEPLPRNRRETIEDEVLLRGAGLRSIEMSLQMLGDVRDIAAELARLQAEEQQKQEQKQAEMKLQLAMKQTNKAPGSTAPKRPASRPSNGAKK